MQLARHAPTGITLRHYQDFRLFDLWGEIRKLPPIRTAAAQPDEAGATGTDGAVVRPVVLTVAKRGQTVLTPTGRVPSRVTSQEPRKALQTCVFRTIKALGATGFEPATSCSQSRRASQTAPRPVIVAALHDNGSCLSIFLDAYLRSALTHRRARLDRGSDSTETIQRIQLSIDVGFRFGVVASFRPVQSSQSDERFA